MLLRRSRLTQIEYMKAKEQVQGNEFLLNKYRSIVSVKEWIHRKDYLGENGRIDCKCLDFKELVRNEDNRKSI